MRKALRILSRLLFLASLAALLGIGLLLWDGLSDDLRKADVALVLGNKVETDGTPSARLKARLDRTVELYRQSYFPWIIVSGGIGKEGFDEAIVMRDYLASHGIPADQILLDNQGINTWESARSTQALCERHGFKSVMVISQYFHIARSKLALRKFGIGEISDAHAHYFEWRDLYSTVREAAGYPAYLVRTPTPRHPPVAP